MCAQRGVCEGGRALPAAGRGAAAAVAAAGGARSELLGSARSCCPPAAGPAGTAALRAAEGSRRGLPRWGHNTGETLRALLEVLGALGGSGGQRWGRWGGQEVLGGSRFEGVPAACPALRVLFPVVNKACYPLCEDLPAAPCPLPLIPRTPELDGRLDAERSRVPDVGLTLSRWVMLCWEVVQDRV